MAKPEDLIEARVTEVLATMRRTGVVTGTSGTKVVVTVQGVSLTLPRMSHYTPVVNDVVIVLGPPPYIVIGKPA